MIILPKSMSQRSMRQKNFSFEDICAYVLLIIIYIINAE